MGLGAQAPCQAPSGQRQTSTDGQGVATASGGGRGRYIWVSRARRAWRIRRARHAPRAASLLRAALPPCCPSSARFSHAGASGRAHKAGAWGTSCARQIQSGQRQASADGQGAATASGGGHGGGRGGYGGYGGRAMHHAQQACCALPCRSAAQAARASAMQVHQAGHTRLGLGAQAPCKAHSGQRQASADGQGAATASGGGRGRYVWV